MNRWRWPLVVFALCATIDLASAEVTAPPSPVAPAKPVEAPAAPAAAPVPPAAKPAPVVTPAPAEKPVAAEPAKPAPAATDAVVLDPTSLEAVIGRGAKSPTGEDMGRVVDMLVAPSGEVRAAVIDFGGFLGVGSRKIAVDWKALNFTDIAKSGNIIVALTRNQVRMAPEYKQGDPIVILEATTPEQAKAATSPASAKPEPVKPEAPKADGKPAAPAATEPPNTEPNSKPTADDTQKK